MSFYVRIAGIGYAARHANCRRTSAASWGGRMGLSQPQADPLQTELSAQEATRAAPLLVFSDDWGRHPSSCQHLISRFLGQRRVVWVNTIGTRPPRLDAESARRVMEKLRQWTRGASIESVPQPAVQPVVLNPRMWPSFGSRGSRALNRWLLSTALRPVIAQLPSPPVVLTTLPITADLVGTFPSRGWLYYCVDDFATWPGYDGETMRAMEAELVPRVDAVVSVSETLAEHVARLGRAGTLLTHGVDLAHWSKAATAPENVVPEYAELARPLVVFWGGIDRRMDVNLLRSLSTAMKTGTIVLVGPQDNPDPQVASIPRVVLRPPVPYWQLPAIGAAADVLVMPYADLPATRAMQPLKLKEYLATGKPVVVRSLPATRPWADACDVCEDPASFAAAVLARIESGTPSAQQRARGALKDESWEAKARQLSAWIDAVAAARSGSWPDQRMA